MDLESGVHSFVIKIWLEESAQGPEATVQRRVWRGRISHVGTSERVFVKNMDEIAAFIRRYLGEDEGQDGLCNQLACWLRHRRTTF